MLLRRLTIPGLLVLAVAVHAAADAPAPFAAAQLAPADVSFYLHVADGSELRARLADRPLAHGVAGALGDGEVGAAWSRLSGALGTGDGELFDAWFGRSCTLLMRPIAADGDALEWAVVTAFDAASARRAIAPLAPRRLAPRHDLPVLEVPEHGLAIALGRTHAVLGPTASGGLFDEVIARLADGAGAGAALADDAALTRARALAPGRVEVFVRHGSPLDGWSAVTAAVRGEPGAGEIVLAHTGHFGNPPFSRPRPTLALDMAPLELFETNGSNALAAVIEPTEIGAGGFERFLETSLGVPLLDGTLRRALGPRRIMTVGEEEGRLTEPAVDLLLPSGAIAFELSSDAGDVRPALDAHLLGVARALRAVGEGSSLVEIPAVRALGIGDPRHVDVGPAMCALTGGFPIMRTVSLNWTVADGPHGSYCVIATHPGHLETTARALRQERPVAPRTGAWATCGTLDGPRVSRHLRSYGERAELLLPAEADPAVIGDLRVTLGLFADLADGVRRCRWQVARPTRCDVECDVQLTLTDAPTAR